MVSAAACRKLNTLTLVALFVLNERKADAERIAAEAAKQWDGPKFYKQMEKAKHGEVPARMP
jgi:hypothetical protein